MRHHDKPRKAGPGATRKSLLGAGALLAMAAAINPDGAAAMEGGTGFYLLGSRTTTAGIVPPPGSYFVQQFYGFSGTANKNVTGENGRLVLDLDASALVSLSTYVWAPETAGSMGGRPYFLFTLPIGYKSVSAGGVLTGPGGASVSGGVSEDNTLLGDPVVGGGLGWGTGPFFGSVNVLVNVPVGSYDKDRIANVSFNRWAADITGAATWLDQTTGWQADLAMGLTVNGTNTATDYRSGNEFHLEAAVVKTFANGVSVGLQGYHYSQVTGDSGSGAVLGDFKGRVSGIGPSFAFNQKWGGVPVAIEARYFHEFNATNRIPGNTFFINFTVPLKS